MELKEFFEENPAAAVAFSGGVDSAYLLYAAKQYGTRTTAYYVKTAFQPQFELDDAKRLTEELNAEMKIIEADILNADPVIAQNPHNRCYYCKKQIFARILSAAQADGYHVICDGTNASDDEGDRPGMKALREMEVKSPLRMCGLSKDEIRRRSKEAGLFTWDKPAYACLATRIRTNEIITEEKLKITEDSEAYLASLGFRDFRVRMAGNTAKLQVKEDQTGLVMKYRKEILEHLKTYYAAVVLDLETRI